MNQKRYETKYHHCELPGEPEELVNQYIDVGAFVNIRRRLKKLAMISTKHPYTRFYLNSISMLKMEERRHLVNYYNMLHPFSMINFCFGCFIFGVLYVDYFFGIIFETCVSTEYTQKYFLFSNACHFLVILFTMFTGYYDRQKNFVVLKWQKVMSQYLRTYFIFDILTISATVFRILVNIGLLSDEIIYIRVLLWALPMFKLGRYPYFLDLFYQIRLYSGMNHYFYQMLKSFCHFVAFLLFSHHILFNVLREFPIFKNRTALQSGRSSLQMILLVSHGAHSTEHMVDKMFPIILIFMGFIVQLVLYSNILQLWHKFYSTENKQRLIYSAFNAYMRYKALPIEKRERIFLYLDFKYQKHFYKDTSIKKVTSESLRKEILANASRESMSKVELFQKLPVTIMEKLRSNLISEIYLPGDIIIKAGTTGKCMFFILAGTVVITTPEGKEVCYLRDGSHFGEIALVINIARVANVTAVTPCELFKLNRKHFLEVIDNFPELMEDMINQGNQRINTTKSVKMIEGEDTVVHIEEPRDFEFVGDSVSHSIKTDLI